MQLNWDAQELFVLVDAVGEGCCPVARDTVFDSPPALALAGRRISITLKKLRMRGFIDGNGMRVGASRMLLKLRARANRSMLKIAAAVRAHIAQCPERAHLAERTFVRANHRVGRVRRQ